MVPLPLAENDYVIDVCEDIAANLLLEGFGHHPAECGTHVLEAFGHSNEAEGAEGCDK
jgi:hypothetical protein